MKLFSGKAYWILLILFAVITLCSAAIVVFRRPYSGNILKSTGTQLSMMRLTDGVTGQAVTVPSKRITFILYYNFASPQSLQDVAYASYLVKKEHPVDIDFVVITGGHIPDLEEMRRTGALPFPLIIDSSFSLGRQLTVPHDVDRSFVVGQDGRVLFAPPNGAFSPEDIRELFERFTAGRITYGPGPPAAVDLVGKTFPNIKVSEIHTHAVAPLFEVASPGGSDYLIFTASCPACMLQGTLGKLKPELQSKNVIPIITSRVPEIELRHVIEQFHISAPLYIAEEEVPGFENVYFDSGALEGAVLRVHTNQAGMIVKVEPIQ